MKSSFAQTNLDPPLFDDLEAIIEGIELPAGVEIQVRSYHLSIFTIHQGEHVYVNSFKPKLELGLGRNRAAFKKFVRLLTSENIQQAIQRHAENKRWHEEMLPRRPDAVPGLGISF